MESLKKHLPLFSERIRGALMGYSDWDGIREIRLRHSLPLSLTTFSENIFLDESGHRTSFDKALICTEADLYHLLCSFCGGEVYRYFDSLKSGFVVNEYGFRLGICPAKDSIGDFMPESILGINLRIPRSVPDAAKDFLRFFDFHPLASTLILSKPGEGKTTLLRSLAAHLSKGQEKRRALRVAVIDERQEIFPNFFRNEAGLCDILSGYDKKSGIEMATRLFAPEVILCDEIGGNAETDAILSSAGGGSIFFASAHAGSLEEAKRFSHLKNLISAGIFSWCAVIEKIPDRVYRAKITLEPIL